MYHMCICGPACAFDLVMLCSSGSIHYVCVYHCIYCGIMNGHRYVSELEFDDAILVLAVLDSLKIAQYSDLQHPLDTLEISCHRWRAVLDAIIGVAEFHDALQLMHARERTMVFGPVGCCTFV
eukprot:m.740820 g.740820  ORF g.740820 m.740820 type:complete len:123 (+) comp23116_c3_seq24:1257-1625(+)